ncbi:MAG: hypothetical protein ABEJ22_03065 [Haloferacaceae archaeon]
MRDPPTPLDDGSALLWLRTDADRDRLREVFDDAVVGLTATVGFAIGRREEPDYEEELQDIAEEIRELGGGSVPEHPDELSEEERRKYEVLRDRFVKTKQTRKSLEGSASIVPAPAMVVLAGEPFPDDVASYLHSRLTAHGWAYALTAGSGESSDSLTSADLVDPHAVTEADVEARIEAVWTEAE